MSAFRLRTGSAAFWEKVYAAGRYPYKNTLEIPVSVVSQFGPTKIAPTKNTNEGMIAMILNRKRCLLNAQVMLAVFPVNAFGQTADPVELDDRIEKLTCKLMYRKMSYRVIPPKEYRGRT